MPSPCGGMLGAVLARGSPSPARPVAANLKAGESVWVRYRIDSGFWQERVLLVDIGLGSSARWATLTPELEQLDEDFSDAAVLEVVKQLPRGVKDDECMGFIDILGRPPSGAEIAGQIQDAISTLGLGAPILPGAGLAAQLPPGGGPAQGGVHGAVPSHSEMLTAPRSATAPAPLYPDSFSFLILVNKRLNLKR